ncbi:MAG: Na+-dependent transporter [Alphaproteobacteria bacterium]|nr:Na+-dependent transporter [Alphaproteobacteria bacterium]
MANGWGFLDRPAAGLAWLGRHGTNAVAISILLGIALPPLGALIRPIFPETVFLLLCLAFLRVDPGALRAQFHKPRLLLVAAIWTMLIVPVLVGVGLTWFDLYDRSTGLLLALMLNVVAPPIFASPALAALMGLNAAVTLALLLTCIAATPFLAPALVAIFVGPAVTFSPMALGVRLVLMLAGAACVGLAVRAYAGKPWIDRQAERIDGLNVVVLFLFAVALMGDIAANTIARPLFVLGLLALGTAVTFGMAGVTALLFSGSGSHNALPLAHAASSRNTGLMLAAAAGSVPELVWLYVALIQIPIYALPLIVKPLARRLSTGA